MNRLMVIPSYNEAENLVHLIPQLIDVDPKLDICIVDDNSPDGTGKKVKELISTHQWTNVTLISRDEKMGRGNAVREGLEWGYHQNRYDAFAEMDGDLSHSPNDIPRGFGKLKQADVVLASRYPNGSVSGWSWTRKSLSYLANRLAKAMIDPSIGDYTNGFRFYSSKAVELLLTHRQQHTGYIYLSESLSLLLKAGMQVKAFPIHFINRTRGKSNTDIKEVYQSFKGILQIGWKHRTLPSTL